MHKLCYLYPSCFKKPSSILSQIRVLTYFYVRSGHSPLKIGLVFRNILGIAAVLAPLYSFASNVDPGGILSIGFGASKSISKIKKNDSAQQEHSFQTAPVYNVEIGYRFNRFLRAGLNPQVRLIRFTERGLNARSASALVNLYLDLDNYTKLTPYLVAGLGYGDISLQPGKQPQYNKFSHVGGNFAFGAGVQIALSYNAGVDFTFRYVDIGKLKLQPNAQNTTPATTPVKAQKIKAHELLLSMYYLLG